MLELSIFAAKVSEWHTNYALKESNAVRGHDKQTPYYVHPIGCAYFIMEDNNGISYEKRLELAVAMMGHDLKEDTAIIENGINLETEIKYIFGDSDFAKRCDSLINKCTLEPGLGSMDEYRILLERQEDVQAELWYLKLVDKYFNIFGSKEYFIKKNTLQKYLEFLEFLIYKVKDTEFKDSSFIASAESLIAKYNKLQEIK